MKYERIKYPDGQISAKITDWGIEDSLIVITERINSYEDLFFIMSLAEIMQYKGITNYHLVIPCLFGQRSDRRFHHSQSLDLKVIADCINSCNFKTVRIYDPHSEIATTLIHRSRKATFNFVHVSVVAATNGKKEDMVLVSPDAGAYKKVFEYGADLNLPVVAAVKHRDRDGKIDLKFIGDVVGKECFIIDDLCDGGFTFIKLAEALKAQGATKVYLYITHAYFSKGLDELKKNIDHIY